MRNFSFLLVLMMAFPSCTENKEFSKADWEYGSEGIFPKRKKYIDYLDKNKNEFEGKTEKEIINIFGEPNNIRVEENTKHFIYFVIEEYGWNIDPQYVVDFRIVIVNNKVIKAEIKESPDNRSFLEKF